MRLLIFLSLVLGKLTLSAGPFIPANDNFLLATTIIRLNGCLVGPRLTNTADWKTAIVQAEALLNLQRATGDGRAAGQAEARLSHWWHDDRAPIDVLFLRAEIKQRNHDFANALRDLDRVLERAPNHVEALILKITICQVLGRYDAARAPAFHLVRIAPSLLTMTTVADLVSLSGQTQSAFTLLDKAMQSSRSTNQQERAWAFTTAAQISLRSGRNEVAEGFFQKALELSPGDPYNLAAYADYLLWINKPALVIQLLAEKTGHDHLLLRLAEAEARSSPAPAELEKHREQLGAGFSLGKLRGVSHGREEARYLLHLAQSPEKSLAVALRNWEVQKEPVDAEILLESSLASGEFSKSAEVLAWIEKYHWKGQSLEQLVKRFPRTAPASATALLTQ